MRGLEIYTQLIEEEIEKLSFPKSPSNLYEPLSYFLNLGGKRMRPILTLLGTELFGNDKGKAVSAALAIEIFHNFTLIHDDIMDEAPLRRNQQTVHTKWNNNIAILSGDTLFVKAYQSLAKQSKEHLPDLLDLFNKTAIEVCEGQQMDMDFESRKDVSIDEYIEMIRLKTSVLLGCALEMGAVIGNASESDRKHIYNFGQNIGIAFQIQDDILDLFADPDKFGKQVGGDVISNKKTLLNLQAFQLASKEQKRILDKLSTEMDFQLKISQTKEIYEIIGARSHCEKEMEKYHIEAMKSLEAINIDEEKKKSLKSLALFLMNREL